MRTFKDILLEEFKIVFDLSSCGRKDWDKDIIHNKKDFNIKIDYMSPEEYLKKVRGERGSSFQINNSNVIEIKKSIKDNNTKIPAPVLIYGNGIKNDPTFHDGNHRVLAFRELGIKKIPVFIVTEK